MSPLGHETKVLKNAECRSAHSSRTFLDPTAALLARMSSSPSVVSLTILRRNAMHTSASTSCWSPPRRGAGPQVGAAPTGSVLVP